MEVKELGWRWEWGKQSEGKLGNGEWRVERKGKGG